MKSKVLAAWGGGLEHGRVGARCSAHACRHRVACLPPHARALRPRPQAQEVRLARETTCTTETFTLPDGRTIRVGAERFTAPEALLNPRWADDELVVVGSSSVGG